MGRSGQISPLKGLIMNTGEPASATAEERLLELFRTVGQKSRRAEMGGTCLLLGAFTGGNGSLWQVNGKCEGPLGQ